MAGCFQQYLFGYVRIRISGPFTEHFLNSCIHQGIRLWDLCPIRTGEYELCLFVRDFLKIRKLVRKTGTKVTVTHRAGLPFFRSRYRKRRGLILGFFLCIFLLHLLSGHIWSIEFSGNQACTDEALLKYLEENNISCGMKKTRINCSRIASEIRKTYDEILWASVSIDGSRLKIQIKENEDGTDAGKETANDPSSASWNGFDLVADLDGVIREIVTLEGVPLVEAGDSVKKGEILVSGQVPVLNDAKEVTGYQFRRADARITAEAQIVYHDTAAMSSVEKTYDSVQKRENFLQVGSFRFSFGGIQNNYKNWTFWGYERHLSIGSLNLPVSYGCRLARPYTPRRKTLDLQAVQKILSASFSRYKEDLEKKGVEIIENNVKIYTESQEAAASGKLKVLTPIGVSKPAKAPASSEEEKEKNTWDLQKQ